MFPKDEMCFVIYCDYELLEQCKIAFIELILLLREKKLTQIHFSL